MTIKKFCGYAILASLFGVVYVAAVLSIGVLAATAVFGGMVVFLGLIVLAIHLISD